ncbi:RNA polymerase factor sigma-54 [Psychrobacillus sp. NPDC096623]|uniref:RNA polymerase factor sigma-54 n=1 Tax=Psychrobacillus sp. NPDC096623 TaxID=3364492 RepID=UPI00381B2353
MDLFIQQRQEMKMQMTVQLRQSIELLQYSTIELEQFIHQQELENPLIELEYKEEEQYFTEKNHYSIYTESKQNDYVQNQCTDFRYELFEQAKFTFSDISTQRLLKKIIFNLDDIGYLQLEPYNEKSCISLNEQEIENGIHLLQQIGPVGIGARNLKECLHLQITYSYPGETLAKILVANHLHLLANHKWNDIAASMNISLTKVKELSDFIKLLNPKPCAAFNTQVTEYVIPDIIVEIKDKHIVYQLNDSFLPCIRMNDYYAAFHKNKCETAKYIQPHYHHFQWLINSLEQRRNTIIKIMNILTKRQEEFFKRGFLYLQPLTLKEVADAIEMHESTVSRATTNKIIQTSFGIFDIRTLFASKLETADGESISQTKVKTLLKNLITSENKLKPYSDQKIAEYFNVEKGISISRRTINKYREELNIPSSSKRKEI